MAKRIKLAGDKGCDAIDPDNIGMLRSLFKRNSSPAIIQQRPFQELLADNDQTVM